MRTTRKKRGFCPRCGGLYAITKNGTPTTHQVYRIAGGVYGMYVRERCPGSDEQVKEMFD